MDFVPQNQNNLNSDVPFYDEVKKEDGWRGHTTSKTIEKLQAEITISIARLGGSVISFKRGTYTGKHNREGFQISYVVEHENGVLSQGRLDVAALPVKKDYRLNRTLKKRLDGSLKMSLYMLREALDGTWFLAQISPGYAPLMPWMLAGNDKTITQLWSQAAPFSHLLPAGGEFVGDHDDLVDGEFTEV